MTVKLVKILSDLSDLMGDWNARTVPTEQEFISKVRALAIPLVAELDKQKFDENARVED